MPVTSNQQPPPQERAECFSCGDDFSLSNLFNVEDERYCEPCYEEETSSCEVCNRRRNDQNMIFVRDNEVSVCYGVCADRYAFECHNCGDYYSRGDVHRLSGSPHYFCPNCVGRLSNEPQGRTMRSRGANLEIADLQSKEKGIIIKSQRNFGVELETVFTKNDSIQKLSEVIHPAWGFVGDGSIHTNKDAVGGTEIVSPVLRGKKGEAEIKKICDNARGVGFYVNSSCGFHLHLEALDFKRNPKKDQKQAHPDLPTSQLVYHVQTPQGNFKTNYYAEIPFMPQTREDQKSGKPRERYPYNTEEVKTDNQVIVNYGDEFYRLRDLFYVYIAFDDVFRAMQPPSRRNNTFCKATNTLYSLDGVRRLQDFNDLEAMWYKIERQDIRSIIQEKENRKGYPKDHTRYSGLNLAVILSKQGKTIEFRYHSPTLNAEKILRWTDLHQTIMDKISAGDFSEEAINACVATETNILKKAQTMCKIFKIAKETEEYVIERLHKFNKFNAKNEDMEDEEVSQAQVGRRSHGGGGDEELMYRPNSLADSRIFSRSVRGGTMPRLNDITEAWAESFLRPVVASSIANDGRDEANEVSRDVIDEDLDLLETDNENITFN